MPDIGPESLRKLASLSPELELLYGKIAAQIFTKPPFNLGYPGDFAQSAYYPGHTVISKEEIAVVSKALEAHSIYSENTRIRKLESNDAPTFEVLQASVEKDALVKEFSLPDSKGIVRLVRGDHAEELAKICSSLAAALDHAVNVNQRLFISEYIKSFQTGDLEAYRDSQRAWITDKAPRIENIFGFVEPYRDPYGTRAEFEGLVAISDTEETRALTNLVEQSSKFIRRLPWADGSSRENDGKGPFEKALFEPPDFASVHGMRVPMQRRSNSVNGH